MDRLPNTTLREEGEEGKGDYRLRATTILTSSSFDLVDFMSLNSLFMASMGVALLSSRRIVRDAASASSEV